MKTNKLMLGRGLVLISAALFILAIVIRLRNSNFKDSFIILLGCSFILGMIGCFFVLRSHMQRKRGTSSDDYLRRPDISTTPSSAVPSRSASIDLEEWSVARRTERSSSEPWTISLRDIYAPRPSFQFNSETTFTRSLVLSVDFVQAAVTPTATSTTEVDSPPPYDEPPPYPGKGDPS